MLTLARVFVALCIVINSVHSAGMCGCEHRYPLLMDLYDATNGAAWYNSEGWSASPSSCSVDWFAVTCSGTDVTAVAVYSNNLVGTLPVSWWNMSSMQEIRLSTNKLSGTVPSEWSSMTQLIFLSIFSNNLSGPLPPQWSALVALTTLWLDLNAFSGALPPSWSSMTQMTTLHLSANNFTGTLPESWSSMTQLGDLLLNMNTLNGTLPTSWSSMTQLTSLFLANNSFTGPLPHTWSTMTLLAQVYLDSNQLSGELPTTWSRMGQLSLLTLDHNQFTGRLPESWSALSLLQSLSLSNNCLTGVVPLSFPATTNISACRTKMRGSSTRISLCAGQTWPPYCEKISSSTSFSPSLSRELPVSGSQQVSESRSSTASSISKQSNTLLTITMPISQVISISNTEERSFSDSRQVSGSLQGSFSTSPLCVPNWEAVALSLALISTETEKGVTAVVIGSSQTIAFSTVVSTQPLRSVTLVGSPSTRGMLGLAQKMEVNISLSSGDDGESVQTLTRWYVGDVRFANGVPLNFTTTPDAQNFALWKAVGIQTPRDGWIDIFTPLLLATEVKLVVTMYCNGEPILLVNLTVPVPANPLSYAAQVEATMRYSQVASILAGGASSGSALGRVMAIRSMVLCDADFVVGGGVIDLGLSICRRVLTRDEDAQALSRSAIVSNVVLIVVVTVILTVLATAWARIAHLSWRASARSLRLPSALLPLLTAVVPSTASSATLLLGRLRSSACVEVDVVLALLGILISLLPCATFVLLWGVKVSSHQWVCTSLAEGRKSSDVSGPIQRLYNTLRRDYQWSVASAQTCTANEELMPAWVILLEFRDLRYGIVDLAVLAGVSCLSVVSGLTASSAQCRGWSFVVLLLLTLQLTALVTARRLTTLFSTVYCATSLCLTIISSLAQLIFVWSYSDDTSALWLVDVSAGCSLAVVGLSVINMIVDGIGLLSAVKRRWRSLLEQQDATSNETNIDTDPDRLPLNQLLQEKTTSGDILEFGDHIVDHDDKDDSLEEILLPESDHLFWDSAGGAVGTGLVDERSDIMQVVTSFRHNLR